MTGALLSIFLSSCGNPPSNSTNINFPYGMAVCSTATCNVSPGYNTGTTSSFAAVTSYGTHQVLIFSTYPASFLVSNYSASPPTSLSNSLQGPDGLLISSEGFPGCTAPVLYAADGIDNKIGIWCNFNPADTSNPAPTITITSGGLQSPEGMALDWVNSSGTTLHAPILFVANPGASNMLAFDLSQVTGPGSYNLSPSGGLISGTAGGLPFGMPANNTSLNGPAFLAFSNSANTLFLSNTGNSEVMVYGNAYCLGVARETGTGCSTNNQNIQPSVRLTGLNTFLSSPDGISYHNGSLYVADSGANSVLIWDGVLNNGFTGGNTPPTRRINGSNTNQNGPYALAIDNNPNSPPGNVFYVSQINNGQIFGYNQASTVSGNIAPTFRINVTNPGLF